MKQQPRDTITGVAWYRKDQWPLLKEVAKDRDQLEDTYEVWAPMAEKMMRDLRKAGIKPIKVDIDVIELINWCAERELPIDASARSQYTAWKLGETHQGG